MKCKRCGAEMLNWAGILECPNCTATVPSAFEGGNTGDSYIALLEARLAEAEKRARVLARALADLAEDCDDCPGGCGDTVECGDHPNKCDECAVAVAYAFAEAEEEDTNAPV